MIHTPPLDDTPGSRSAARLRDRIAAEWPDAATSASDHVHVFANVKCFGREAVDLDLVVLVDLAAPRPIPGIEGATITSALLVIEEKDHPPEKVEFEGGTTRVRYGGRLHNATEQVQKQVFALGDYAVERLKRRPFVVGLLWLKNVEEGPVEAANVLTAHASWRDVLGRLAAQARGPNIRFASGSRELARGLAALLGNRLVPTGLDRKRMDRVSQSHLDGQKYAEKFGEQLLVFKGQGGTGKTITLLRIARDLAVVRGHRVLFLTYNLALVSDLRRLVALMTAADPGMRRVEIDSAMRFFREVCKQAGVLGSGDDFVKESRYPGYLDSALGVLRDSERRARLERSGLLQKDSVFVDEAQDWKSQERDLLYQLFGPGKLVLADGMTQLVRKGEPLDWRGPAAGVSQVVNLRKGLRLKRNLAAFVSRFARGLEHDWEVEVVPELLGGRVVVLEGPPTLAVAWCGPLIHQFRGRNVASVDLLACVPPSLVSKGRCTLDGDMRRLGVDLWDGCSPETRRAFPADANQLRVVQYDSCRGLEGWAVFAFALDHFWDHKNATFEDRSANRGLFDTREMRARRSCANWLMIPMTRAIDTLVVNVTDPRHPVSELLRAIEREMPDVVEWVRLEDPLPAPAPTPPWGDRPSLLPPITWE
jgi:hypothetical protein